MDVIPGPKLWPGRKCLLYKYCTGVLNNNSHTYPLNTRGECELKTKGSLRTRTLRGRTMRGRV